MPGRWLRRACLLVLAVGGASACGANSGDAHAVAPASPMPPAATTVLPPSVPPPAATTPAPTSSAAALVPAMEMKPPVPTAMVAELRALSLDPQNLPPIGKLDPKALRGVMKLVSKSLGAKCGDCHQEGDFAAPTPRKKIAAKMWDEFVTKLSLADDGAPIFCDSCHQGRTHQLDRSDEKALSAWMAANFVQKLKRKDEADVDCETCHVHMDMRFLNKWAGTTSF